MTEGSVQKTRSENGEGGRALLSSLAIFTEPFHRATPEMGQGSSMLSSVLVQAGKAFYAAVNELWSHIT